MIEVEKKRPTDADAAREVTEETRPPPRDRSAPQKSNSDDDGEPKEKVVLMSDDTKHLPKKRYILLVDRERSKRPRFRSKRDGNIKNGTSRESQRILNCR